MKIIIDGKTINIPESSSSSGGDGGVPKGTIVIWSGSVDDIPSGWALCDGANGTPDLRDRFVLGAGKETEPGLTGGKRNLNTINPLGPWNVLYKGGTSGGSYTGTVLNSTAVTTVTNTPVSRLYLEQAGNAPSMISIMPPYYTLCYIMKISESNIANTNVSPYIFSDDEVCIGEWFGQPLYRKKFEKTFTSEMIVNSTTSRPISVEFARIPNAKIRRTETYIATTTSSGFKNFERFPYTVCSFSGVWMLEVGGIVTERITNTPSNDSRLILDISATSRTLVEVLLVDKPLFSFIDYTKDKEDPIS